MPVCHGFALAFDAGPRVTLMRVERSAAPTAGEWPADSDCGRPALVDQLCAVLPHSSGRAQRGLRRVVVEAGTKPIRDRLAKPSRVDRPGHAAATSGQTPRQFGVATCLLLKPMRREGLPHRQHVP